MIPTLPTETRVVIGVLSVVHLELSASRTNAREVATDRVTSGVLTKSVGVLHVVHLELSDMVNTVSVRTVTSRVPSGRMTVACIVWNIAHPRQSERMVAVWVTVDDAGCTKLRMVVAGVQGAYPTVKPEPNENANVAPRMSRV